MLQLILYNLLEETECSRRLAHGTQMAWLMMIDLYDDAYLSLSLTVDAAAGDIKCTVAEDEMVAQKQGYCPHVQLSTDTLTHFEGWRMKFQLFLRQV